MGCESCGAAFSVWRRRRACGECGRGVCAWCWRRGAGRCAACTALQARPLARAHIAHLKPRDLQCFLQRQNVSTRGCVEKEELITLCLNHVNSGAYRKPATRVSSTFSTLKGFTSNINDFINNTFDIRLHPNPTTASQNARASAGSSCHNSRHPHAPPPSTPPPVQPVATNNNGTPGATPSRPPPPFPSAEGTGVTEGTAVTAATRLDTADCFEIEDVEDAGWEIVDRAVDPLPNDSEVLLTVNDRPVSPIEERAPSDDASPHNDAPPSAEHLTQFPPPDALQRNSRMTQEDPFDDVGLRVTVIVDGDGHINTTEEIGINCLGWTNRRPPSFSYRVETFAESAPTSPQHGGDGGDGGEQLAPPSDTSPPRAAASSPASPNTLVRHEPATTTSADPRAIIQLDDLTSEEAVTALSVRQLKELLVRNRVEIRGCVEREELLQRALLLWRDHTKCREQLESLPLEECCKVCMAAPLECVLLECGHMATCTACARVLPECPICRRYVTRAVRFFRS